MEDRNKNIVTDSESTTVPAIVIRDQSGYAFNPQEDITAFELAQILPLLVTPCAEALLRRLPENVQRHFEPTGQAPRLTEK